MTIYRTVVESIIADMGIDKEMRMKELGYDEDMYNAYLLGRVKPILVWLMEDDIKIAD